MALVTTDDKHYKAIAEAIRTNAETDKTYLPEEMADGVNEAYAMGRRHGDAEGYIRGNLKGVEEGMKAQYDAFWDAYQQSGKRVTYQNAFSCGWTQSLFKPKYLIKPGSGNYQAKEMFYWFGSLNEPPLDWRTIADKIDLSNVTDATFLFNSARINYIDVDLSNATTLWGCFNCEWQITGRTHLTLKVSEKCKDYTVAFNYCADLTHLIFKEGSKIAANMTVSSATNLVKDSIESIVNALWDDASGKTLTLSLTAVKKAFQTSSGSNDGNTSEEWLSLVASKSNWTISLA